MSKGATTRQRIIAEAAPIFNQRGFAGASMQDIMDATGLEKGGLYRHFSSKQELAAEAFRYSFARVTEARAGSLDEGAGAIDKLRREIDRFIETPSPIAGGCPIMNAAVDAGDSNPALLMLVRTSLKSWKRRLATIVRQGIRSGEIRAEADPRRIANIIIATLEGTLLISRLEGTRIAFRDARTALDLTLNSLKAGA